MANIQERRDKSGKLISYSIRVHRGRDAEGHQLKPYTATFSVEPTWTEKSARKKRRLSPPPLKRSAEREPCRMSGRPSHSSGGRIFFEESTGKLNLRGELNFC